MPALLELPAEVTKGEDGRWYKSCPSCGSVSSYLRRNYAILSYKEDKLCKKCSNSIPKKNQHNGWAGGFLRRSFINKYKLHANLRGYNWELSDDYLAQLLIEQDFKCALTRWPISAVDSNKNTGSLDRIDSSIGYVVGNVQWVHRMVNMCKQQYSQSDFIEMCNAVSINFASNVKSTNSGSIPQEV